MPTTTPKYGELTSDPVQMAKNRADFVAQSGGLLKESGGKVVSNSPTVFSNANIIENKIPEIKSDVNKFIDTNPPNTAKDTTGGKTENTTQDTTVSDSLSYLLDEQKIRNDQTESVYKTDKAMLDNMKSSQDQAFQNQLNTIQKQYDTSEQNLKQSQSDTTQGLTSMLASVGANRTSEYSGILQAKKTFDIQKLNELHDEEQRAISGIMTAKLNNDYQAMSKQLELAQKARKDKQEFADKIIQQNLEQQKVQREQKQKTLDEINKIVLEAGKNGATSDIIQKIGSSKTLGEAVTNAGDYLQGGTGIVGEYNFYKKDAISRDQIPLTFDEYQTRDANRKVSLAKAGSSGFTLDENGNVIETGNYDALTIGRYNRAVNAATTILQKNPTFKNIIGSSAYLDRIEAAVKNPGSVGDQELLDAFTQLNTGGNRVTEAQVHLITNNQSIGDMLNKYKNKLLTGGALSDAQRKEIVSLSQEVYKNYQKSYKPLYEDATKKLKAQGIPKEFWNLPSPETLSRAVNDASGNDTSDDIIQTEEQAKSKVLEYGKANPNFVAEAKPLLTENQPELGRPMTYEEVMNLYNIK